MLAPWWGLGPTSVTTLCPGATSRLPSMPRRRNIEEEPICPLAAPLLSATTTSRPCRTLRSAEGYAAGYSVTPAAAQEGKLQHPYLCRTLHCGRRPAETLAAPGGERGQAGAEEPSGTWPLTEDAGRRPRADHGGPRQQPRVCSGDTCSTASYLLGFTSMWYVNRYTWR